MTMQRWGKARWIVLGMLLLSGSLAVAQAVGSPSASPAQLQLRWEVQRNVFTSDDAGGRSWSSFTLTNIADKALPAQGWAIYFNCVAGVELKEVEGPFLIERVSGTWYRFRPSAGFSALATGQATRLSFFHPEIMVKTAKGPTGPYIVFDEAPGVGHAISDYRLAPFTRAEQWDHGASDPMPIVTAQELFKRNASIVDMSEDALPPVFPTPQKFERRVGALQWTSLPAVVGTAMLKREVALATALLKPYFAAAQTNTAAPKVNLLIAPIAGQSSDQAYELNIDPATGITVTGNSVAGVALGLRSLRQLLPLQPQRQQGLTLAALHISDAPRFAYRGVQLDVARNFQPKATVLRLLDLMARYKLNKFHFHLTDDEGWRLEIPGLPELTSVGARRGHTLDGHEFLQPAYGSGPDVNDAYGSGFYTGADYIDILKYAASLHIEVIPEIEMPGHARAAVKSMESRYLKLQKAGRKDAAQYRLNDPQDSSVYRSPQLYTDHVMNPGLPSTYAFIQRVVDQVVALHQKAGVKLNTIHVGADELPNGAWEKSPATHALMKGEKLASTTEVWDYFYQRVNAMLHRHGLFASGWEELGARKVKLRGESKLIPNPTFTHSNFRLYVWNNLDDAEDLAYRMANSGYKTILAPATNLYFDMSYNKNPDEPGVNWAAYTDLSTVFDFIPFDSTRKSTFDATPKPGMDGLTDYGQQQIVGLEGVLFSETVRSRALMDYLLMPRMLALSERAWAPDPAWTQERDASKAKRLHDADWSVFVNQLGKRVLPQLDAQLPGVQYRIASPGLQIVDSKVWVNHQTPGFILRYTSDGSEPNANSPLVSGAITAKGVIQVAAFNRTGRQSRSSRIENP
ncbi:MAG: family 20 glycosylhydrolase [Comamonadaceae bacterium]